MKYINGLDTERADATCPENEKVLWTCLRGFSKINVVTLCTSKDSCIRLYTESGGIMDIPFGGYVRPNGEVDSVVSLRMRDYAGRIEAAHKREVEKLTRLLEAEADDKLRVIAELNEVRELNRKCCDENGKLRECLKEALSQRYCSKWRKALEGANNEGK